MASSKVMASTSPANPDLPRHPTTHSSSSSLQFSSPSPPSFLTTSNPLNHTTSSFGSVNMEDILKNMYPNPDSLVTPSGSVSGDGTATGAVACKAAGEVWKEIVEPRMTLEDFLTKAGAVSEEEVRPPPLPATVVGDGGFGVDALMGVSFPAAPGPVVHMQNGPGGFGTEAQLGFGNGMVAAAAAVGGGRGGGGRGKRRGAPVEEIVLDKATQQKQRRMIKNRESAARSRERKQAYTVELESLVTQLEEENARLVREEAEQNKERLKQLMENLIPVLEKRRPSRPLRRVQSMNW